MNKIECINLSKSFFVDNNKIEVLDNINISIKRGDLVALSGRSGAGKSTLLQILASLDAPSSGSISISKRHKNGPLAIWEGDLPNYTADIVGVTRGEVSFVAFNLKHKSGILHDPFSTCFTENQQFHTLLENPPTKISGEIWPEHYFPNEEE